MPVLSFRWFAKYGHFLRAEANVSALSYPIPPRTAVLGLLGAILGLEKDQLPEILGNAQVAIGGTLPSRFWHRIKLRKDPPTALPRIIKKGQKGNKGSDEQATLVLQEWLWQPSFLIHVAMPDNQAVFTELYERIAQRRWYFSPCMGLSELLAEVELIGIAAAKPVPAGKVKITSIFPQSAGRVLNSETKLGIHLLRMPREVSPDRVFSHQNYYIEHQGQAFIVETEQAWSLDEIIKTKMKHEVGNIVFC